MLCVRLPVSPLVSLPFLCCSFGCPSLTRCVRAARAEPRLDPQPVLLRCRRRRPRLRQVRPQLCVCVCVIPSVPFAVSPCLLLVSLPPSRRSFHGSSSLTVPSCFPLHSGCSTRMRSRPSQEVSRSRLFPAASLWLVLARLTCCAWTLPEPALRRSSWPPVPLNVPSRFAATDWGYYAHYNFTRGNLVNAITGGNTLVKTGSGVRVRDTVCAQLLHCFSLTPLCLLRALPPSPGLVCQRVARALRLPMAFVSAACVLWMLTACACAAHRSLPARAPSRPTATPWQTTPGSAPAVLH